MPTARPRTPSSDAVVALDLDTGAIRWMRQVTPGDVYLSNCRAGNPNCPEDERTRLRLRQSASAGACRWPRRAGDRQKSGMAFALDPQHDGEVMWEYRAGQGGVLGGIEWGAAVDGENAYFAVSDILQPKPGGIHAVRLATGQRAWFTPPPTPACGTGRGCNAAQSAAVTAIPGVVFSGSNDGALRAYSRRLARWSGSSIQQGLHERSTACRRRARRSSVPVRWSPVVWSM